MPQPFPHVLTQCCASVADVPRFSSLPAVPAAHQMTQHGLQLSCSCPAHQQPTALSRAHSSLTELHLGCTPLQSRAGPGSAE